MTDEKECTYGRQERPGIQIDKPCNKPLYDDEYCIFHSEDIERKKDEFGKQFWTEFERQRKDEEKYDFYGFVFPSDMPFEKEFEKEADFGEAIFYGGVIFRAAKFKEKADFWKAQFKTVADFREAEFSKKALFREAEFSKEAISGGPIFREAHFNEGADFRGAHFFLGADFGEAKFFEEADFEAAQFSGITNFGAAQFSENADFGEAQFSGMANFGEAQFSENADFLKARFSGKADFLDTQFSDRVNYFGSTFSGEKLEGLFTSLRNSGIKRILKGRYKIKDFRFHLSEKIAKVYPVIDRMTKDAWYLGDFKKNHPFIYALWNVTANCGRSIWRWISWSLFFAFYFAFNFYLIHYVNPWAFNFDSSIEATNFGSFLYYSIVTFTTLGFGDIIPTANYVQRWVMAEVIMGYVMLGGLISIFANKLARRS